jgi:CheY-like chemotaxis protein
MKTILIADDNATSRELFRAVLEHSGHIVIEACNGADAVRGALETHPDLIFLDLVMPDLSGFEVLDALRHDGNFNQTPIVALTASAMNGDREQALDAGFSNYLTKPVSVNMLRNEMGRWLINEYKSDSLHSTAAVGHW